MFTNFICCIIWKIIKNKIVFKSLRIKIKNLHFTSQNNIIKYFGMIEILIAICLGLFITYLLVNHSSLKYPPGPPCLPLIGSMPFMGKDMRKIISKFHKKYGPVFGFKFGPDYWIVISDYKLLKDALNREEFQNRPVKGGLDEFMFKDEKGGTRGVMFSNGSEWQEQRRFVLKNLRDFGFGKQSMEHLIQEEVEKCTDMIQSYIKSSNGQAISLNLRLNIAILNALWHIATGETLNYDDPHLNEIINKINDCMTAISIGGLVIAFPWLKYLIPGLIGYTKAMSMFDGLMEIINQSLNQHMETFQGDHPRDLMDVFIKEIEAKKEDPKSSFHGKKGIENMIASMMNLFVGGSETTSNTLNFGLFYLSKYPEIQNKAFTEIEKVIGFSRLPSLDDRQKTPYVEAVVLEVTRITSLSFAGIPREVTKDTTLGGYFIPKGTNVMAGIYEIMHDKEHWGDPEVFRPERFLDETRTKITNTDRLIPFGAGRRICIGISLAQNELYLFLASFLQKFQFSNPSPTELEPIAGFVLGCPNFCMDIQERPQITDPQPV